MPLDVINRLMEAAEIFARDITKRLERIEGKLDDITKDPKIKGFYYCDPPEGFQFYDDLSTHKVEVVQDPVAENPPCFNCTPESCLGCGDLDNCPLASDPDDTDEDVGICDRCPLASRCFV
jgi:hypothetical protein